MTNFFRFDEFEVDGEALELRRAGERTPATPPAVRALLLLLRSAGRLVTREELYAELWPAPGVDVERGLLQVVAGHVDRHGRVEAHGAPPASGLPGE